MGNPKPFCICTMENSLYARRCFMTGEYCSKQSNVHKERNRLHPCKSSNDDSSKYQINAFVIMNYSSMSDIVFKWRLQNYIESLKKYLFISPDSKQIACVRNSDDQPQELEGWHKVEKIDVIRADSSPASNYVMCHGVCQQIQIADLIIVDVSVENSNVFYEFGMAVAFGKLILPMCFSDRYFEKKDPPALKASLIRRGMSPSEPADWKKINKHIDFYPWQRQLFEHYGLRFRKSDSVIRYLDFISATNPEYGFSDMQYNSFPYQESLKVGDHDTPGKAIYHWLQNSYNIDNCDSSSYNTLIVYTMDDFLNGDEAGRCIINFYTFITEQMQKQRCFCGDRVGILGQSNSISEDPKDDKTQTELLYNVSDIIRIGMNEATYAAERAKIKSDDYLDGIEDSSHKEFIKGYTRNRSIPINTDNPIYVNELRKGIQRVIPDKIKTLINENSKHAFCLFHVMLHTLCYTKQIVVDISNNSIHALFWLGAAHGSDVHAITVKHISTEEEKARSQVVQDRNERRIVDVAGLWTATLRADDTENFYKQLEMVQTGFEQQAKLMLNKLDSYAEKMDDFLYMTPASYAKDNIEAVTQAILSHIHDKRKDEKRLLESFYRERFWRQLLRQNQLRIYLARQSENAKDTDPRIMLSEWDVEPMSELSFYLSKRQMIGEYDLKILTESKTDSGESNPDDPKSQSFICIGANAKPYSETHGSQKKDLNLPEYIARKFNTQKNCAGVNESQTDGYIRVYESNCKPAKSKNSCENRTYRGFYRRFFEKDSQSAQTARCADPQDNVSWSGTSDDAYVQFYSHKCTNCTKTKCITCTKSISNNAKNWVIQKDDSKHENQENASPYEYVLPAQLVLWREILTEEPEHTDRKTSDNAPTAKDVKFQVSLIGVSGPATKALTALLVDHEQKKRILLQQANADYFPLIDLQSTIRDDFLKRFEENATAKTGDAEIVSAAKLYLSSILYQYFLPFLTLADEVRIANSLEAFLMSFHREKKDDPSAENKSITDLKKVLKTQLRNFQGVDAIYEVKVRSTGGKTDSRQILDIKEYKNKDHAFVSMLYCKN